MREITLSVVMTTYNHERYIAQAIECADAADRIRCGDCCGQRLQ